MDGRHDEPSCGSGHMNGPRSVRLRAVGGSEHRRGRAYVSTGPLGVGRLPLKGTALPTPNSRPFVPLPPQPRPVQPWPAQLEFVADGGQKCGDLAQCAGAAAAGAAEQQAAEARGPQCAFGAGVVVFAPTAARGAAGACSTPANRISGWFAWG